MALFSFDDIKSTQRDEAVSKQDKKQSILVDKYLSLHTLALNNINELNGRLPNINELYFIWTLRSFNTFTFLQYIISKRDRIDDLVISSYNMGRVVIMALMKLYDSGAIEKLNVMLSDVSKSRFPKNYDLINLESSKREGVTVSYRWNHSKVALARCGENYYVVEGSGNFADNSRHEQYLFTNNKILFDFRKDWMLNEIDKK